MTVRTKIASVMRRVAVESGYEGSGDRAEQIARKRRAPLKAPHGRGEAAAYEPPGERSEVSFRQRALSRRHAPPEPARIGVGATGWLGGRRSRRRRWREARASSPSIGLPSRTMSGMAMKWTCAGAAHATVAEPGLQESSGSAEEVR
jgi:hypothetical protein